MSQPPPAPPPGPPPAPPPQPGGAAGAFSVGETISYAWNTYWKNVGPLVIITIVILVISAIVNGIGVLTDSVALNVIFTILAYLVGLFLSLGLIRATLAVTAGRTPEVGMLFEGYGFGPYIVASIVFAIGTAIGFVLCIIPGIIFAIVYWFYGYVIVEEGQQSPMDALRRSADITRGHRGELFVLGLALIGINIVGALLCLVGLLFTHGISAVAIAHAYRTLKGQAVSPAV